MTKGESLDMIQARLKQLEEEVTQRSSHKNPMYYAAVNNLRWCRIVLTLMKGDWPMDKEIEAVNRSRMRCQTNTYTQPISNIDLTKEIAPGTNVMDILNKYRESVPDIHDRLKQAVTAAGFTINGFYIVKK